MVQGPLVQPRVWELRSRMLQGKSVSPATTESPCATNERSCMGNQDLGVAKITYILKKKKKWNLAEEEEFLA